MHSLLSLGDSYTIGEGVPLADSYPYQTVQLLRRAGHPFGAPEIIARTGWTTDELAFALDHTGLLPPYTAVTLLIGVNNQYRGRTLEEFQQQFEQLLQSALRLTPSSSRVFVLPIPDWGISPFATREGHDPGRIAREIDAFNAASMELTRRLGAVFVEIAGQNRTDGAPADSFTADGLHPAAILYRHWAQKLAGHIRLALAQ
jgi:lysophospholipase L1-like esterase